MQRQQLEEDDIEWYDDEDDGYNDDKQEAEMSIESFKSNVKQQNEFEFFRSMIHHLKEK